MHFHFCASRCDSYVVKAYLSWDVEDDVAKVSLRKLCSMKP